MRWYETHHPFDTDEVVSKRWHNLIYILSSAIFSFGYATFSSCIWQQVAIFQLYRVINLSLIHI